MLVVLDIGNSAIKFGVYDGDRLVAVERVEGGAAGENLFPIGALATASEVVAVSSSPANSARLEERLGRPVRLLGDEVRRAVATSYRRPGELGLDRLAAAWGSRALTGARSVAVADAGTAITVDALDAEGRFVAVAIAPGVDAGRCGLARAAPHLPSVSAAPGAVRVPARSTDDSLRAGLVVGFAGLLDRLVEEARRAAGGVDAVVLTGGAAPTLSPHMATPHRLEPHAVLRGVLELHRAVPA